jgi:hypothetical protein
MFRNRKVSCCQEDQQYAPELDNPFEVGAGAKQYRTAEEQFYEHRPNEVRDPTAMPGIRKNSPIRVHPYNRLARVCLEKPQSFSPQCGLRIPIARCPLKSIINV